VLEVAVSKSLGEFRLEAVLEAGDGITVLFGPSGAGKSLTLALVAGLLAPDGGRIVLDGRTLDDPGSGVRVPTQDRRIGMVFQDALLLPHRSVLDNVALAVRDAGGRAERRERARRWLEHVGAEGLAGARPRTLSGGQRQRVALARALAGEPRLLLLDEPFGALDLPVRRELRGLVRRLVSEQATPALFVTHDPDEARGLADVLVRYDHGRTAGTLTGAELAGHLEAFAAGR
jgi:molybdate transport system ATP-binding protein